MNLQCDLEIENNNIFLHKALLLMMMYRPIKFGYKNISSSADMVEAVISDYMSLYFNPALEDSKPIFLHNTLPMMMHHHTKFGYRRFSS